MRRPFKISAAFKIGVAALAWLAAISVSHFVLNGEGGSVERVLMGYMPVVSNLASPLVDLATRGENPRFEALKFSSFSEMAEAFRAGHIQAAFIIAPLAIMLFEQGVPLKIVYIGNRHESTMVVRTSARCGSARDLIGKTIAVPMRYSGHYLALKRWLRSKSINPSEVNIIEMPPPDMPSALAASQIDGYFVGEPFASKALETGTGKRFLDAESIWPEFICNLLIVRRELIRSHPERVRQLVKTAIESGMWARDHVEEAVDMVTGYWGQDKRVVRYAFSNPPGRFRFDLYTPRAGELEEIAREMAGEGFISREMDGAIVDDSFAKSVEADPAGLSKDFISKLERGAVFQARAAKQ